MKKSKLFSIACCFSMCVLAIQILILRRLLQKEKKEKKVDFAHVFISKVLNLSFKHNVPLLLTDPKIFKRIHNGTEEELKSCHFLCSSQKVLHLATIGPLSTQMQKIAFMEAIEGEGFNTRQFFGSDPVLLQHGLNSPIPLHYIISDEHTTIHISVFYERPAKFWWTGGYYPSDKELHDLYELGIRNEDFQMISKPAAFDKVEIHSAAIGKVKIFVPVQQEIFLNYPENTHFIECNYTLARHFHETFGRDESDEAEVFRSKAFKLLSKAKMLLDHLKVPFWLSSGTCLGDKIMDHLEECVHNINLSDISLYIKILDSFFMHSVLPFHLILLPYKPDFLCSLKGFFRECGFISYSKDVDIGIWIKDYKPEIISAFSTHDLPLTHSFGKVEDSFELSFRDNDLKLDIFFFYEEETYMWNGGTQARTGKKFKYVFPKFHLCWTEFLEMKVRVPCQTEEYIKANYGPKWFEPVKVWDWKSSPPNVLENGQWPFEEWPEVIQLLPLPEQN